MSLPALKGGWARWKARHDQIAIMLPNDEGGMAWNDPEIGIEWPQVKGAYPGSASAEGYTLEDGTKLNLSDKDQKLLGIKRYVE